MPHQNPSFPLFNASEESYEYKLPMRWTICPCCSGDGTFGPGPGSADIDPEALSCGYDPDSGVSISNVCPECHGSGKVQEVNYDRIPDEIVSELQEWYAAGLYAAAEAAAERRMGA